MRAFKTNTFILQKGHLGILTNTVLNNSSRLETVCIFLYTYQYDFKKIFNIFRLPINY